MPPIVATLISNGLGLLANAVMAKGQEVIEEKLGVKLEEKPTQEQLVAYKRLELEHEEFLVNAAIRTAEANIKAEAVAQSNVTERWRADSSSDSWLARNIRPLVLAYLTVTITLMASLPIKVEDAWIELLKAAFMLVLGAYFVGRTVEKNTDIKTRPRTSRKEDRK